jgi:hypothetical protein
VKTHGLALESGGVLVRGDLGHAERVIVPAARLSGVWTAAPARWAANTVGCVAGW